MSTDCKRRLLRDFKKLQSQNLTTINATPNEDDIMKWEAVIFGPEDSIWEGGTFRLSMQFTAEYPNKPPEVKFITRIFHPNVYVDGRICLDILQSNWSPIYDISAILRSIQSLLTDPNISSPANNEAARLYSEDRKAYNKQVKEVVESTLLDEDDDDDDDDVSISSDDD